MSDGPPGVPPATTTATSRTLRPEVAVVVSPAAADQAVVTGWEPWIPSPRTEFESIVEESLDEVPEELMAMLDNVVFLVEDEPPADDPELLGVYDGVAADRA